MSGPIECRCCGRRVDPAYLEPYDDDGAPICQLCADHFTAVQDGLMACDVDWPTAEDAERAARLLDKVAPDAAGVETSAARLGPGELTLEGLVGLVANAAQRYRGQDAIRIEFSPSVAIAEQLEQLEGAQTRTELSRRTGEPIEYSRVTWRCGLVTLLGERPARRVREADHG